MLSRFDLESPESEKLTDSVSEKEEKEVDETEQVHRLTITLLLLLRQIKNNYILKKCLLHLGFHINIIATD